MNRQSALELNYPEFPVAKELDISSICTYMYIAYYLTDLLDVDLITVWLWCAIDCCLVY